MSRRPITLPPRTCLRDGCSNRLVRRTDPWENTADWRRRVFCSDVCNENRNNPVTRRPAKPALVVADDRDTSWQAEARCKKADPRLFGPVEQFERNGRDRCRRVANLYCRPCPSRNACFQYAEEGEEQGCWGGALFQNRGGKVQVEPLLGAPMPIEVAS
jgi:hypothetical protein